MYLFRSFNKNFPKIILGLSFIFLLFLSFLRDSTADETYYLRETLLMSTLLKNGIWFGNYGVGLHGFLFKLPAALLFLITGPYLELATLITILLSVVSLLIFYKINKLLFKTNILAVLGIVLLFTNLRFLNTSVTFLRDIPALFTTLLFIYALVTNKSKWLLGFILFLMLDAKEYVFFTIVPILVLWEIYVSFSQGLRVLFTNLFAYFIFPAIYLFLMFSTSVVPLNMYNASISGLIENGLEWSKSEFSVYNATVNPPTLVVDEAGTLVRISHELSLSSSYPAYIRIIQQYLLKILNPSTFSFLSVPKIITFPSLFTSIYMLIVWLKKRDYNKVFLSSYLLFFSILMIIRSSNGRYLLSVVPLIYIFFVYFLTEIVKLKKTYLIVVIIGVVYAGAGLFFEEAFFKYKIILNCLFIFTLLGVFFTYHFKPFFYRLSVILSLLFISLSCLAVALAFSSKIGQIKGYSYYGYNRQVLEVAKYFGKDEKIMINNPGWDYLIQFYRGDVYIEPEVVWTLSSKVPKKASLKVWPDENTYSFVWRYPEDLKADLANNHITKLALIESNDPNRPVALQDFIYILANEPWLKPVDIVPLKYGTMHVYEVVL
jgi:hypothetical protein